MSHETKVNPSNLTNDEAGALLNVTATSVGNLVRTGKLARPITIEALREYAATRGARTAKSAESKWFRIKLTPEQFEELSAEYEVEDPAEKDRARREERTAAAAARVQSLGLKL